jgi:predicted nucleic acid-binding protein
VTLGAAGFILDTGIVLHLTRAGGRLGPIIESAISLRTSSFRPAVSEVTVAELWAFAMSASWGDVRRLALTEVIDSLVVLPISLPGINQRWSELATFARQSGRAIGHNDLWIAATAEVTQLTLVTMDNDFRSFLSRSSFSAVILDPKSGAVVP